MNNTISNMTNTSYNNSYEPYPILMTVSILLNLTLAVTSNIANALNYFKNKTHTEIINSIQRNVNSLSRVIENTNNMNKVPDEIDNLNKIESNNVIDNLNKIQVAIKK